MKITVPHLCWYDNNELDLLFPDSWDIKLQQMNGHANPKLSQNAMREAFSNPIGSNTIRELAINKKKVVIIFDDITRPTRVSEIVP